MRHSATSTKSMLIKRMASSTLCTRLSRSTAELNVQTLENLFGFEWSSRRRTPSSATNLVMHASLLNTRLHLFQLPVVPMMMDPISNCKLPLYLDVHLRLLREVLLWIVYMLLLSLSLVIITINDQSNLIVLSTLQIILLLLMNSFIVFFHHFLIYFYHYNFNLLEVNKPSNSFFDFSTYIYI